MKALAVLVVFTLGISAGAHAATAGGGLEIVHQREHLGSDFKGMDVPSGYGLLIRMPLAGYMHLEIGVAELASLDGNVDIMGMVFPAKHESREVLMGLRLQSRKAIAPFISAGVTRTSVDFEFNPGMVFAASDETLAVYMSTGVQASIGRLSLSASAGFRALSDLTFDYTSTGGPKLNRDIDGLVLRVGVGYAF